MTSRFLAVRGRLQRAGLVVHVVAEAFIDLSEELRHLSELAERAEVGASQPAGLPAGPQDLPLLKSRDFH
jgi:error-prone DNA polymerase